MLLSKSFLRKPNHIHALSAIAVSFFLTDALSGCSKQSKEKSADAVANEDRLVKSPAKNRTTERSNSKILDPGQFVGQVRLSYIAASRIPEEIDSLFCYCGCDFTEDHLTLLDCYKSDHSANCIYCQGEAMLAFKMHSKGATRSEIQKAVDLNWGPHYPFPDQPSETIKRYWRSRQWASGDTPTAAEKHDESKAIIDPFSGQFEKRINQKGECCNSRAIADTP